MKHALTMNGDRQRVESGERKGGRNAVQLRGTANIVTIAWRHWIGLVFDSVIVVLAPILAVGLIGCNGELRITDPDQDLRQLPVIDQVWQDQGGHVYISIGNTYSSDANVILERSDTGGFVRAHYRLLSSDTIQDTSFQRTVDQQLTYRFYILKSASRSEYSSPKGIAYEVPIVQFGDPTIESWVRGMLGKDTGCVCPWELAGFTLVTFQNSSIGSLTGMEYFTGLQSVDLLNNQVQDIAPLAGLNELQALQLGVNKIIDITPLESLSGLQVLDLHAQQNGEARLSNIGPLAELTQIWDLALNYNSIVNIDPLRKLTNMYWLNLSYNGIAELDALSDMHQLAILYASDNSLNDIDALAGLTSLHILQLDNNRISDISPLLENLGIGANDSIWLHGNELWDSIDTVSIDSLRARHVTVFW